MPMPFIWPSPSSRRVKRSRAIAAWVARQVARSPACGGLRSLRLNVSELHYICPFFGFVDDELLKVWGRACENRTSEIDKTPFHRRIGKSSVDCFIEPRNRLVGGASGRDNPIPAVRGVAR